MINECMNKSDLLRKIYFGTQVVMSTGSSCNGAESNLSLDGGA